MTIQKLLIALFLLGSQAASADTSLTNFSFTGSFANDNDVQLFDFSLLADSTTLRINTLSLIGGTNDAGTAIAAGGFDPYLSVWDKSTGEFKFDTTAKNPGAEARIDNASDDPYGTLAAGNYILALSQFDNTAVGTLFSEGFAAGQGLAFGAGFPSFVNNGTSGHWAVDIINVDSASASIAAVPLPGAIGFMVSGLLGLVSLTRRKITA